MKHLYMNKIDLSLYLFFIHKMSAFDLLNLCEIEQDELIVGQKYMIIDHHSQYCRILYSIFKNYATPFITDWGQTVYEIHYDRGYPEKYDASKIRLYGHIKKNTFYKFTPEKEKIQNAMESRAINLILQNIIGDKLFTY